MRLLKTLRNFLAQYADRLRGDVWKKMAFGYVDAPRASFVFWKNNLSPSMWIKFMAMIILSAEGRGIQIMLRQVDSFVSTDSDTVVC